MANQLDAIGDSKDRLPEIIDARQVAELCGRRSPEWAYRKLADPGFPLRSTDAPALETQRGSGGAGIS
jgi:hypothetical protein